MPAIITHHLFGCETYDKLSCLIGESRKAREAFLLGNIGPDPLFCLKALPAFAPIRTIGTIMHNQRPSSLLAAIHTRFIRVPCQDNPDALRAFALGFACHYLLDSRVHLLVYAQQEAIVNSGVDGLGKERGRGEVHAFIETSLDEYLLAKKRGLTTMEFWPHAETLRCDDSVLRAVSAAFTHVWADAYKLSGSRSAFASSVKMYRTAQLVLDARRTKLGSKLDYARLAGPAYLHVRALMHTGTFTGETPYSNCDHVPWPHPFESDDVVCASFDELYENALEKACDVLPAFAQPGFSESDVWALTRGVNFNGQQVESLQYG